MPIRAALERLVAAVGETQHDWPSQELRKAYNAAYDLLHPEEVAERERFCRNGAAVSMSEKRVAKQLDLTPSGRLE